MFETLVKSPIKRFPRRVSLTLDTGSDFTVLNQDVLYDLGYTEDFLKSCPVHGTTATSWSGVESTIRYIDDFSIEFSGDRAVRKCRIFFTLESDTSNLLGSDILKYFNYNVNLDKGELTLTKRENEPPLSNGESRLFVYSLESSEK
jgi:predicted aspartyl protease